MRGNIGNLPDIQLNISQIQEAIVDGHSRTVTSRDFYENSEDDSTSDSGDERWYREDLSDEERKLRESKRRRVE